ncbi:PAP2 superfamily domain-containing protein [Phthorimaea operculella]|nr:PAP2 superfamily domain-containing protein [Phthorimaea operculella]
MDNFVNGVKLLWSKTNRFHRVLLIFVLMELKLVPGGRYGFHCNDPALSHKFDGDTITLKWLFAMCILLPLAVMLLVERIYHNEDKTRPNRRAWRWHKEYIFGFLVNLCFVHVLKHLVGSPRPHFFDTCKPNEATTCESSEFVSSYTCTGEQRRTWDSDRSFPSGHTSLAIYAGLFTIYYLHMRAPPHARARVYAQAAVGACALWCCVSRMLDHRHHWWDVLAGAAIGCLSLVHTALYLCKNFECRSEVTPEVGSSGGSEESTVPLAEATS